MNEETRAVVKIGGREYTLKGCESEEYMHRVAIYVNKKMQDIEEKQFKISSAMLSDLTAVNLADEVLKLQDEVARLQKEIKDLQETLKKLSTPVIYEIPRKNKR